MWHVWETGFLRTLLWWRDLRERGHFKDLGLDGIIMVNWISKKWDGEARTGLMCLRIGTGGGLL
jgi:hypothetical protein